MTHRSSCWRARTAGTAISILALVFTAACGAGNGSSDDALPADDRAAAAVRETSARDVDPCTLVTAAEAEHVLAMPVDAARPAETNNESLATCRYIGRRGDGLAVLVVSVSRQNGVAGFENVKQMQKVGFTSESVPEVGDEAFWVGDPLNTLYALHDGVFLSLGGDIDGSQARPLARLALERLP